MVITKCPICSKRVKNITLHNKWSHPEGGVVQAEPTFIRELESNILPEEPKAEPVIKGEGEIAKILYEDVVVVVCRDAGIDVISWEGVDKRPYLAVARKILGKEG